MTNNMKKDFQKVVKMFRDSLPDVKGYNWSYQTHKYEECMVRPDFPKAMMTQRQIDIGTATVNFGGDNNEQHKVNAEKFMEYEPFKTWCESYEAKTTKLEVSSDKNYQVRINF